MRLVSLAPSCTEILQGIGAIDEIVGITSYCNWSKNRQKPEIVGGWLNIDLQKVAALKPDLIFASTFLQENIKEKLSGAGFEVHCFDPKTADEVAESMLGIGKIVSREKKARRLANNFLKEISAFLDKTKNLRQVRVYCEEWPRPPTVSGNWVPDILAAAGCMGICERGERSRPVALSELKNFDPEIIIANWCGCGTRIKLESIISREGWRELPAVKNRKVFVIDDNFLNSPDQRLLVGMEEIAKLVHPELFGHDEKRLASLALAAREAK